MWPKTREETIELIECALDEGDFDEAARLCRKACKRWSADSHVWTLAGETAFALGNPKEASELFQRAIETSAFAALAWCGLSKAAMEMGERAKALEAAVESVRLLPDDPEHIYTLAIAMELNGKMDAAAESYARAASLSPEFYFVPYRVGRRDFDQMAKVAVYDLPEEVRGALGQLEIEVRDTPEQVSLGQGEEPLNPLLLGVFMGYARGEQSVHDPWSTAFPSRVFLFQRNIERACPDRAELERQIRITVFHEVGHFLGLNEEEIHGRGLG